VKTLRALMGMLEKVPSVALARRVHWDAARQRIDALPSCVGLQPQIT
jgi:hypothetical protein